MKLIKIIFFINSGNLNENLESLNQNYLNVESKQIDGGFNRSCKDWR